MRKGLGIGLLDLLQQLFKRGLCDNTLELRLKILNDADVAYDHVKHFPLALDVMQPIIDRHRLAIIKDYGLDSDLSAVLHLSFELDLFSSRADGPAVGSEHPLGQSGDEFRLLINFKRFPMLP